MPAAPALNPVGNEKGLFFNSWVINSATTVSGVVPHTLPNEIVTAIEQQATNGTPTISPVSPYKSFDLYSFYFGCPADSGEGSLGAAVQCTISVAGFQGSKEVAVASFTFSPPIGVSPPPTSVPMILAQLDTTFRKLTSVTMIQGTPAAEGIVADDFNVALYKSN